MNTLLDLKNKLYKLYKEALEEYPIVENQEEDLDLLNRISYIIDSIYNLPKDYFEDFISLFAVWYYTSLRDWFPENDFENFYNEEDENNYDAAINSITNDSYQEFINKVENQEDEILESMIDYFLEFEALYQVESPEDINPLEQFENWELIEQIQEYQDTKDIFEKFHPNLEEELRNYSIYKTKEKYIEKASKFTVKSVIEFLEIFSISQRILNNKDAINTFLYYFLLQMSKKDEKIFNEIVIFIFKYDYVKAYLKNDIDINSEKLYILNHIKYINDISQYEYLLENFYDFNLTKFSQILTMLPENINKDLELITLNNLMTYGEDGIWENFSIKKDLENIKNKIYRICPSWIFDIESSYKDNNLNCDIYFSKDNNQDNSIPRICIITNENNEVINIMGKEINSNIEYSVLDILENKVKTLNKNNNIIKRIDDLKYISNLSNKVLENEELTHKEIDFLYEITQNFDYNFFGHHDKRLEEIREKTNIKANLAKYYNCEEKDIAINQEELNENTIILTKSLNIGTTTCNYPKLRVIFGNLFCSLLKDATGLKSLEVIKGDALFESLENSKGLDSLIYIEKNARFTSLKDISHLNPNLYVGGKTYISGEKNPKILK